MPDIPVNGSAGSAAHMAVDSTAPAIRELVDNVWSYYRLHGRDLAWRHNPTPYQVFVSEIMLQQTQVSRVQVKYAEWMARFLSFELLAAAPTTDVLAAWQGLGYNRRALWIQRAAQIIVDQHAGKLPSDPAVLVTLPGVGPNTAGSIAAFAYDVPVIFIETNIRRVFIHHAFPEAANEQNQTVHDRQILPLVEQALDYQHPREWYYALMDYGSHLAKTTDNPNRRSRHHQVQPAFAGSLRQLRGQVIKQLVMGQATLSQLGTDERLAQVISALVSEGFIQQSHTKAGPVYKIRA